MSPQGGPPSYGGGLGSHKKLTKYKRGEKLLLVADTWVIADLSHSCFKDKCKQTIKSQGVKEQRADGFSISRNLDFVRCTLVAGKPVFGLKIQPHSYNHPGGVIKKIYFFYSGVSPTQARGAIRFATDKG